MVQGKSKAAYPGAHTKSPLLPFTGVVRRREHHHSTRLAEALHMSPDVENACKMVSPFSGRESIFSFSHTNEFCGTREVAREPGLACGSQKVRRWVHEGEIWPGGGPPRTAG